MLHQRAFTLFELLVVIVIVGVILSFATLSVNVNTPAQLLQRDLQRLQALMQLTHEEAILQGQAYGLSIGTQGYRFYRWEDEAWLMLSHDSDVLLRPRQWTTTVAIQLQVDGLPVRVDETTDATHLAWLSDGEATPFVLMLSSELDNQVVYRLAGDSLGELALESAQ